MLIYYVRKVHKWYAVEGSDTTMMPMAASLFGQQILNSILNLEKNNESVFKVAESLLKRDGIRRIKINI